jgi:hypothetical protein
MLSWVSDKKTINEKIIYNFFNIKLKLVHIYNKLYKLIIIKNNC